MNKLEIKATDEFNKLYKCYGYDEFLRKALNKCANKKELGLTSQVTLTFAEPGRSFDFINENHEEFYIRYFIQDQTEKTWSATYTLFKSLDKPKTIGNVTWGAEPLSEGYAKTHYVDDEDMEDK